MTPLSAFTLGVFTGLAMAIVVDWTFILTGGF